MAAIAAPRGTHDILPDGYAAYRWVLETHARVAESHGYRPVETPVFEAEELFARAVGQETDVVEKQMFTFEDRGGRRLALRPETTAGVMRAALSAHLHEAVRPVRLHAAGPMFRAERPQAGRQRQFTQVDIECIGERDASIDAEIIEIAWRFLEAVGISAASVQLNSLGDAEDRARYRRALVAYYEPLRDQLCDDCKRRLQTNPLRLLDCRTDARFVAGAPAIEASLSAASRDFFTTVQSALQAANIPFSHNPRLVRGLDYYTDTVFELWHDELSGAQNALGGGGRYDGLAELLGYPPTPGAGYAIGVERIVMVARALGSAPAEPRAADVLVASVSPAEANAAAATARTLRSAGFATVLDAADRRLDRKLRNADRLGARVAVLLGEEEVAGASPTVRDLREHTQQRIPAGELEATLRSLLADR
jgi:histidyl-tRNA synthetase